MAIWRSWIASTILMKDKQKNKKVMISSLYFEQIQDESHQKHLIKPVQGTDAISRQ